MSVLCYSPLAQGLLTGKFATPEDVPPGRRRSRHFSSTRPETRHSEPGCEEATFEAIRAIGSLAQRSGISMTALAVAWLKAQEGVTSILAGARSAAQVVVNIEAASTDVPPQTLGELDRLTVVLKQTLGSNPDPWQSESRYH